MTTTIASLLLERWTRQGDQQALHVKRDGEYAAVAWREFIAEVARGAEALRSLGVRQGDYVAQVAENRYEWLVSDLAILLLGAVHVPVHATLAGPQIAWQVCDCQPRAVLISGPEIAERLANQPLPSAPVAVYDRCEVPAASQGVRLWSELTPELTPADVEALLAAACDRLHADLLATVLYTSGTTGEPKGVMLSHGNLVSNAQASVQVFGQHEGDVRLSWLPLSHIFARTCDLYTWVCTPGVELGLAESRETLPGDLAAVRPTLLNGVPYFFEKVQRFLSDNKIDTPEMLQGFFGGRLRMACSGGAALPDHVARFYNERGVRLVQGYGLTETSPVISVLTDPAKTGSVGRPLPGVEVAIAADGEILTRGPHVMLGYRNRPEATAETIRDGWLHTGDLGRIDDDGYLFITGRKKELIVTAGGKNVAPVLLESLLSRERLILQSMVIGDGRNYLTALIVPNLAALQETWKQRQPDAASEPCLTDPRVQALYAQCIREQLSELSPYEQIARFHLLAEPFSVEREELTPSLKMRRNVIAEHYAAEIEALYARSSNADTPPPHDIPS